MDINEYLSSRFSLALLVIAAILSLSFMSVDAASVSQREFECLEVEKLLESGLEILSPAVGMSYSNGGDMSFDINDEFRRYRMDLAEGEDDYGIHNTKYSIAESNINCP